MGMDVMAECPLRESQYCDEIEQILLHRFFACKISSSCYYDYHMAYDLMAVKDKTAL